MGPRLQALLQNPKWLAVGSNVGTPTVLSLVLLTLGRRQVELHLIVHPDARECFHSHPARAWRLILWGGYVEEMGDRSLRRWRPLMFGPVSPDTVHRIHRVNFSVSLWFRGPRTGATVLIGRGWNRYYRQLRKWRKDNGIDT